MEDMAAWGFASCSIVPVGLTRYREGLARLRPVDRDTANQTIDLVDAFGAVCLERTGSRMFFCSDELYIRAGRPLPDEDYYEDYVQIENGVASCGALSPSSTPPSAWRTPPSPPPPTPSLPGSAPGPASRSWRTVTAPMKLVAPVTTIFII